MTGFTANFNLPYPTGTDRPCDFVDQWCDFATAVNGVLNGFQATIDRTVPVIPAAQLRATLSRDYATADNEFMEFDTVGFDTAGWIDFDANPRVVSTDRAAVFGELGNSITEPNGINSYWTLQFWETDINGTLTPEQLQVVLDRGTADVQIGNEVSDVVFRNTPVGTLLRLSNPSTTTFTVASAALALWWHADNVRAS